MKNFLSLLYLLLRYKAAIKADPLCYEVRIGILLTVFLYGSLIVLSKAGLPCLFVSETAVTAETGLNFSHFSFSKVVN